MVRRNLIVWPRAFLVASLALGGGIAAARRMASSGQQLYEQALAALTAGRGGDAESLLRRALARQPEHAAARLLLGQWARQRGEWARLTALLGGIPDDDAAGLGARMEEGDAWLKLNRAVRAEDCWRRAHEHYPDAVLPRRRLLYLYAIQLRRRPWIETLWELYDRGEAELRDLNLLMVADHMVWGIEDSPAIVGAYTAADPADRHSRRALAVYLLRAGRADEAMLLLGDLLQSDPGDAETWFALVEGNISTAQLEPARRLLAQPPTAATGDYRLPKLRGLLAFQERRFSEAAQALRQALTQAPYDLEGNHKMAQALRLLGEERSAEPYAHRARLLATIERACHTMQEEAGWKLDVCQEIVRAAEELGRIEEARGWVKLGLTHAPDDPLLLRAGERLAQLPATSSRHPPPGWPPGG